MTTPTRSTRFWSACAPTLLIVCATLALSSSTMVGQSREAVSAAEFARWGEEISNWGRWGDDDELGTLNLLTPEKRRAATRLVQDGGFTRTGARHRGKRAQSQTVSPGTVHLDNRGARSGG